MSKYRYISIGLRASILAIDLCILVLFSLSLYTISTGLMGIMSNLDESIKVDLGFNDVSREYFMIIRLNAVNNGFVDMNVKFDASISTTSGIVLRSASNSTIIPPHSSKTLNLKFTFSESDIISYGFDVNPPYLNMSLEFRVIYNLFGLRIDVGNIRIGGE